MKRKWYLAVLVLAALAVAFAVVVGGAYYASRQVQPFYRQALETAPHVLEQGSREMESRATALYSDARRPGRWQALFTADQINGWLATKLLEGADPQLVEKVREPRVAISPHTFSIGFRTTSRGVETAIAIEAGVSLTEAGTVAVQLKSVRAGALPLPVMQLADDLAEACQKLKLPIRWTQHEGNPTALVELPSSKPLFVDEIQLDDNQLYIAGHTRDENAPFVPAATAARMRESTSAK
ncbi:MAG: hypothetical protein IT425_05680 [Pirellulales bacterium]|nr:hypothetical protein [Pirellulales bacterium]